MIFNWVFKFVKKIVDQVLDQIMKQINVVGDQIQAPFESFLKEILSGAWEGDDADRFVEEVRSVVLPEVSEILNVFGNITGGVQQAADIIESADSKVQNIIDEVGGLFGSIF